MRSIVVLATLDTKEAEALFVAGLLQKRGFRAELMDVGVRPPATCCPDVDQTQVAAEGGLDLQKVSGLRRDEIMHAMGAGAGRLLARGWSEGRYHGVIALGGNQGTAIAGTAFQSLPLGAPKVIVSTVASGNLRPYFGHKDVAVLFSVADLLGGPNVISEPILSSAAGAITGMVEAAHPIERGSKPVVAVTALGNTHVAVKGVSERLRDRGFEVVAFHASGASGSAMEELIDTRLFDGVMDLTTHELLGEVFGQDIYAPTRAGRLTAAARQGLVQVVAPGGLDYFIFAGPDTVPASHKNRAMHYHNPNNTNVRATADELKVLGRVLAERLNAARPGTAAFLYPERGWSEAGSAGGPLYDPSANAAFLESLREHLSPHVEIQVLHMTINDPRFAEIAVETFERLRENLC